MRSFPTILFSFLALTAPLAADHGDRWEGRHHRRERIVVIQPPCRDEYRHDRRDRRHHDCEPRRVWRPEPVVILPATRRAPWLSFGVPMPHGQVVVRVR